MNLNRPTPLEVVKETRATAVAEMTRIAEVGVKHNRDLTPGENKKFEDLNDEVKKCDERIKELTEAEKREQEDRAMFGRPDLTRHPLAFTREALDGLQSAIDSRTAARFEGSTTEKRAALATGTFGAARVWGSNVLDGPRLLHSVAGVPAQQSEAIYAQYPVLTLPTAGASVGENTTLAEFASSTAGSVTLARYGRWTDLSRESLIGADAGAITAMHRIAIAKDLDNALIGLVNTAAGGAVAFSADVPAAIRKAMAGVIDATAAASVEEVVVLTHPDNAALLQSVTPVGGETIGQRFADFSGSLVYASSAVPTGFMLVANLKAGCRYFEARGVTSETDLAVKTGTLSVATSVISGYGLGLAGGAFAKVDVVTP